MTEKRRISAITKIAIELDFFLGAESPEKACVGIGSFSIRLDLLSE